MSPLPSADSSTRRAYSAAEQPVSAYVQHIQGLSDKGYNRKQPLKHTAELSDTVKFLQEAFVHHPAKYLALVRCYDTV